ncbi:MAG: hypothetical protein AAGI38_02440 [Bacteroidota bacterium]
MIDHEVLVTHSLSSFQMLRKDYRLWLRKEQNQREETDEKWQNKRGQLGFMSKLPLDGICFQVRLIRKLGEMIGLKFGFLPLS